MSRADGSFSGFYAWLKEPLSQDARQTELIQQAWTDSGKVYGYRKLTDDLRDAGETCSENRGHVWPALRVLPCRSDTSIALVVAAASLLWSRTTH